jgi:hypothetical protein
MKGQTTAITAVLALVLAGSAYAGDDDRAVPRGGGSSGGSSSAADRQPSGGSGSSSGSSSSYSGSSSSSSSSHSEAAIFSPPLTDAQRRQPRAGTGTGRGRSYGGYYNPRYYDNYYFNWGLGWHYGYSPFYYPGYYGYGYDPYPYNRRYYSAYRTGSVRVMVEPRETRVYVDGYYAGIADDFDGLFQRLNLSPGRHEVALKLEGHRSFKVRVYVPLDQTVKIRHRMAPGTGEDESADVVGRPDSYTRYEERRDGDRDRDVSSDEPDFDDDQGDVGEDGGTLRLAVSPADASVYVDGDFRGTVRQLRRLRLSPGKHRVEFVRPGYRTMEREVEIRAGRATELQIDLDRS